MFTSKNLIIFLHIYFAQAAVLIWSNQKLPIYPLQPFNDDNFEELIEKLGNPETFVFKSSEDVLPSDFQNVIKGYYSAYNANGNLNFENTTELLGNPDLDVLKIKQTINTAENQRNILAAITIPNKRSRRDTQETTNKNKESTEIYKTTESTEIYKKPEGPVIYIGKNKRDEFHTLLYSSQPLLLRLKNETIYLGSTSKDMIIVDDRVNIHIPTENGDKIVLRFSISWVNGYWSVTTVKITNTNDFNYNLTAEQNIIAAAHFSYHCNGETVFTNTDKSAELILYDLQIQLDAAGEKFGDASDCITFTTAPIWSGLFVTSILGIGLIVAITAIIDIKTMDKFQNQKTKHQLTITVSE